MSTQPLLQRTANKRIALPIRVEPKVSFANERTFLSWLHFTVVLGGLAVGLLNFGDKVGKISAALFSIVGEHLPAFSMSRNPANQSIFSL
ncbi:GTPase regulator Nrf1 [Termitomyces sp. Mn162]|nr:GTPase regulator Nrf1 [Termitomyces sp. Mn162]